MNIYIKYMIVISMLLVSSINLFSQNDKDIAYNQLLEKYGDLSSIDLKFKSLDNQRIEGSITAKKGNKYIIRMGNRIITCNSKNIWNYSIDDNNVIVSKFDKDLHSNSIEQMFFTLLQDFSPVSMQSESSSKGTSFTLLTLASDPQKDDQAIERIKLWIDRNNEIASFSLKKGKTEEKWAIWEIKTNKTIKDKTFDFKVPKGAELIDLR